MRGNSYFVLIKLTIFGERRVKMCRVRMREELEHLERRELLFFLEDLVVKKTYNIIVNARLETEVQPISWITIGMRSEVRREYK